MISKEQRLGGEGCWLDISSFIPSRSRYYYLLLVVVMGAVLLAGQSPL
jgi:hypothetical protein